MPQINPQRLLTDLHRLRTFGARGTGVIRPSLSEVDLAAREWLREGMVEAGLDTSIDGAGTVFGRSRHDGPALLLGSHTDTQPRGGWLDGAFGVVSALEVARTLAENEETADLAVDVASWIDEEGTYLGFLGARSFCGDQDPALIETATNLVGERLTDALERAGLAGRPVARMEEGRYIGYVEAHIEQGPHLEVTRNRIGVVTGIVGIRTMQIRFRGVQNHAGTTPMPLRKDAGVALVAFASRLHTEFPSLVGERSVWTIGRIHLDPGASSIIPGAAELTLQFRDPELERMDALEAHVRRLVAEADAAGPVSVEATTDADSVEPATMDADLLRHLDEAAELHAPGLWMRMPSGAGHDAQVLARRLPAAMLFVPSIGGISHDFAEDTAEDDLVLGCQVLATAAASILRDQSLHSGGRRSGRR